MHTYRMHAWNVYICAHCSCWLIEPIIQWFCEKLAQSYMTTLPHPSSLLVQCSNTLSPFLMHALPYMLHSSGHGACCCTIFSFNVSHIQHYIKLHTLPTWIKYPNHFENHHLEQGCAHVFWICLKMTTRISKTPYPATIDLPTLNPFVT